MPQVSVFTPTNDAAHLMDAYRSLDTQTHTDWEWVIVPNGKLQELPATIVEDPRVRIEPADLGPKRTGYIGALKSFAVSRCKGRVLVELDHDDKLTENAIRRIVDEQREHDAGFLYSDFVGFEPNGSSVVYPEHSGWEQYTFMSGGRRFSATRAFEMQPASFSTITLMPNHVRAFTRDAYDKVGGYDADLKIADDFDLTCRMWTSGVRFRYIPECLYFYRVWPQNSSKLSNKEIRSESRRVSNRYFDACLREWCRRNDKRMVNVTTTPDVQVEGCESLFLDRHGSVAEAMADLEDVGYMRVYDTLHTLTYEQCRELFSAAYRSIAPQGIMQSATPSTDGRAAFSLDARSFWNDNTFWAYTNRFEAERTGVDVQFGQVRKWVAAPTQWDKDRHRFYVYADLVPLKGQRFPGRVEM